VEYKGLYLGDGGMVNNVPASPLKEFGCDFVISINISGEPGKTKLNPKSLGGNILRGLDILMNQSLKKYVKFTDFELKPNVDKFTVVDFKDGMKILQIGVDTITEKLDELKRDVKKRGILLKR
jgi:NTE family protein